MIFKKSEVAAIVGLSPRAVQFYTDLGLIKPYRQAKKRGSDRLYDEKNLMEFHRIYRLKKAGFTLEEIKKIMDVLRK